MFAKIASLLAIGLGVMLLSLISMVYLSIEALGTTMEEVTVSLATSIETGSGAIATGMDLMPVRGVADPTGTGGEAALDPPALQVEARPELQMPQGNQPDPVQEGKAQVDPDDSRQGQARMAYRPILQVPGSGSRTGQVLRYGTNGMANTPEKHRMDGSRLPPLMQAGALTVTKTENGEDYQLFLPGQTAPNDSRHQRFLNQFFVFFAPVTEKDEIRKWFTNVQTVSKNDHILIYQVWNNRDEPLPENIPENYRLEYLAVEGPDPTASYPEHEPQPYPYYALETSPNDPSGHVRFGEIDPEMCALAVENSNQVETEIDCLDYPDLYQFHFPIGSHDRIVTWHQAADFVAGRDSRLFWRLLPQYSETSWQKDSEGEHHLLQYYDDRGNTLHPYQFNLEERHEGCLCLKASQHGEVAEWFAAQRALQDGPTQLYWAPVWEVELEQ